MAPAPVAERSMQVLAFTGEGLRPVQLTESDVPPNCVAQGKQVSLESDVEDMKGNVPSQQRPHSKRKASWKQGVDGLLRSFGANGRGDQSSGQRFCGIENMRTTDGTHLLPRWLDSADLSQIAFCSRSSGHNESTSPGSPVASAADNAHCDCRRSVSLPAHLDLDGYLFHCLPSKIPTRFSDSRSRGANAPFSQQNMLKSERRATTGPPSSTLSYQVQASGASPRWDLRKGNAGCQRSEGPNLSHTDGHLHERNNASKATQQGGRPTEVDVQISDDDRRRLAHYSSRIKRALRSVVAISAIPHTQVMAQSRDQPPLGAAPTSAPPSGRGVRQAPRSTSDYTRCARQADSASSQRHLATCSARTASSNVSAELGQLSLKEPTFGTAGLPPAEAIPSNLAQERSGTDGSWIPFDGTRCHESKPFSMEHPPPLPNVTQKWWQEFAPLSPV
eukprot:GHVN01066216.1.p1 GENE.GHVN01066216.1~~GHVN01066216.1.p1  ORF type:complete len:447 (+),score=53.62 GHVN01066216.1:2041-3381(+)